MKEFTVKINMGAVVIVCLTIAFVALVMNIPEVCP